MISPLDIVTMVNALRAGVVLIEDLQDLADSEAPVTEEEALLIIDDSIASLIELRDND